MERSQARGSHGSTSRFCIHNTLLAAGPDIRVGFRDELPSGNVDVAPTILHLLGVQPEKPFDGRILTEALLGTTPCSTDSDDSTDRGEA
jgi:arylsulfatase A-like enzyme